MKINQKSDYLTVLIGSYNRLDLLKKSIEAVRSQTSSSYEIIVIDGGSTDGTVEYLRAQHEVTSIFQEQLLGAARAYNEVWQKIDSKYTCWLSDDTELVNKGLDIAVDILENNPEIGMVGLKTRDVAGKWTSLPYIGALSDYGILNCNHGVLPMSLLRSVGYFNQDYKTYLIDPDLTASILCVGKKVVMTKEVCVLHNREWADENWEAKVQNTMLGINHYDIYLKKFTFLQKSTFLDRLRKWVSRIFSLPLLDKILMKLMKLNSRDWLNLTKGRFISLMDVYYNAYNKYHNVQKIHKDILRREGNPYKHFLEENV